MQVKNELRRKHYSIKTEKAYIHWLKQYFYFHKLQHPQHLHAEHVRDFLTYLAVERHVSAATQSQALNALAFLYHKVLRVNLGDIGLFTRPKRYKHTPAVLSEDEVRKVIKNMRGRYALACALMYGTGMRINELITLRVHDIDLANGSIIIRNPKGNRTRVVFLPQKLMQPLSRYLLWRKQLHINDTYKGWGYVNLPNAMNETHRKAQTQFEWQYVFPSSRVVPDRHNELIVRRWHTTSSSIRKALQKSARECGISKRVAPHTLRHSFATHLLLSGTDVRTIQELMGHKSLNTTMVYMHVAAEHCKNTPSPFDKIWS